MAKKTDTLLDPEAAFEAAARHWRKCRRCKRAGQEKARLENCCAEGREILQAWDAAEEIYDTAEAA